MTRSAGDKYVAQRDDAIPPFRNNRGFKDNINSSRLCQIIANPGCQCFCNGLAQWVQSIEALLKNIPCAKTVLIERTTREKKVVVPTRIHTKWPSINQDTKAPHSSAFHGRIDLIDIHLNRTLSLCRKLVAADKSSSLVGR